jgi:hypothetical protein
MNAAKTTSRPRIKSGHSATYQVIFTGVSAPIERPIHVERWGPSTSTPNASAKPIKAKTTIQRAMMRRRTNPRRSSRS